MAYGRLAAIGEGTTTFTMANKSVIMTEDNIVCICSDIEHVVISANDVIFELPDSAMFPANPITLIVFSKIEQNDTLERMRLIIGTDGKIRCNVALSLAHTFFTNGLMFHVNDKYYNSTIGNAASIPSSPLDAR